MTEKCAYIRSNLNFKLHPKNFLDIRSVCDKRAPVQLENGLMRNGVQFELFERRNIFALGVVR